MTNPTQTIGIVIVDHGSTQTLSNELLEQFAAAFAQASRYPIVEPAHMTLAEPTIATAIDRCVERGATRIIVSPFFLLPGQHSAKDIPRMVTEATANHPNIPVTVAQPLGTHPLMSSIVEAVIEDCLSD